MMRTAATYRNTVLTTFPTVEDSLSAVNHLRQQMQARLKKFFSSNQQLFASERAQRAHMPERQANRTC